MESYRPDRSQQDLIEASLDHPIAGPGLEDLVRGKKNIAIISSDHTPPGSFKIITPILLRRIRAAQPAEAVRDAALSFRGESVLIIGHKHINALLMCALLKEPLARFGSHIVEDALPYLLATDAIERLCSGGEPVRASN